MKPSLSTKIKRFEANVKVHGLWRLTSTTTSVKSIRDNILQYLDETTKPDVVASATPGKMFLVQGVEYLTKEAQGKLKAFGFNHSDRATFSALLWKAFRSHRPVPSTKSYALVDIARQLSAEQAHLRVNLQDG